MMKWAIIIVGVSSLTGCAYSTGVVPISEDLYSLSEHYAPIRGGAEFAKTSAFYTAEEYCVAHGAEFSFVSGVVLCMDNNTFSTKPCDQSTPTCGVDKISGEYSCSDPYSKVGYMFHNNDKNGPAGYKLVFRCIDNGNGAAKSRLAEGAAYRQPERVVTETGNAPLTIDVSTSMKTSEAAINVSGRILSEGKVSSLTVDGSAAPFNRDGLFSFTRAVPIGESEIHLIATNEWGKSGDASVRVVRTVSNTAEVALPPLDPNHLKGKTRPTAIALIIGIEKYENAPPAEFAASDARSFYDYATNALGVPQDRIKLLIGSDARRLDIEKAMLTWLNSLVVRGQTDVFVFFSGHGLASGDGKDLFLFPYDGDSDLLAESAIRRRSLIADITGAGAASATFFLDTCYSGGTRGGQTLLASARPILVEAKEQNVPPNVTILAAAANDQLSSSLMPAKHGMFSYFLMKGLEGDAAGADHTITAATLETYLAERIPVEAAKLGRVQTPQLIGEGSRVVESW